MITSVSDEHEAAVQRNCVIVKVQPNRKRLVVIKQSTRRETKELFKQELGVGSCRIGATNVLYFDSEDLMLLKLRGIPVT